MSAPATFASSEVALHVMQKHFPCGGHAEASAVTYECPCQAATIYTCGHCGTCLTVSLADGRMCEHVKALYEATDGMRRAARVIDDVLWISTDIEMSA